MTSKDPSEIWQITIKLGEKGEAALALFPAQFEQSKTIAKLKILANLWNSNYWCIADTKTKDALLKELAKLPWKQNFKRFIEDSKSRKVKKNNQISDSCVWSITCIIDSMHVLMCACTIACIKQQRLYSPLNFSRKLEKSTCLLIEDIHLWLDSAFLFIDSFELFCRSSYLICYIKSKGQIYWNSAVKGCLTSMAPELSFVSNIHFYV